MASTIRRKPVPSRNSVVKAPLNEPVVTVVPLPSPPVSPYEVPAPQQHFSFEKSPAVFNTGIPSPPVSQYGGPHPPFQQQQWHNSFEKPPVNQTDWPQPQVQQQQWHNSFEKPSVSQNELPQPQVQQHQRHTSFEKPPGSQTGGPQPQIQQQRHTSFEKPPVGFNASPPPSAVPPPPSYTSYATSTPSYAPEPMLVFSQQSHTPFNRYGATCCHCREGIPECTQYKRCSFCRLDMCAGCAHNHPASHANVLQDIQQYTFADPVNKSSSKSCSVCKQYARLFATCTTCSWLVCNDCFFRRKPLVHAHKEFTVVLPPSFGFHVAQNLWTTVCNEPRHVGHCSKCLNAIPLQARFNMCTKCHRNYGDSPINCLNCGPPCIPHLTHKHNNLTVQYELVPDSALPKGKSSQIHCARSDCNSTYPTLEMFISWNHKHKECTVKIAASGLDTHSLKHGSSCLLRSPRQDAPPTSGSMLCRICMNSFPMQALSTCSSCLQKGDALAITTCQGCAPLFRQFHSVHAAGPGKPAPSINAAHPSAVEARRVIAARAAAAARQKKKNQVGLLGLGLKVGLAVVGADIGISGGGGGFDFSSMPMPDLSGIPDMPMLDMSVPDMEMPDVFSGPVSDAAMDGIQG